MANYVDDICRASYQIAKSAIDEVQLDKTIKAIIIDTDKNNSTKYKIQYQDAYFYAFAKSSDIKYTKNTYVYITIPNGNMDNVKYITGKVNNEFLDSSKKYIRDTEYNLFHQNNGIKITINNDNNNKVLYNKNNQNNDIYFTETELKLFIKTLKEYGRLSVDCAFEFENDLFNKMLVERTNFGLEEYGFEIIYGPNDSDIKNRKMIVSSSNFIGNPYLNNNQTLHYDIFQDYYIDDFYVKQVNFFWSKGIKEDITIKIKNFKLIAEEIKGDE